ncbi:DUF7133 domain-containing protein [Chitinophaga dinghuensis]|nr:c-type cytochrome [Chitinophaga dinghuensis]
MGFYKFLVLSTLALAIYACNQPHSSVFNSAAADTAAAPTLEGKEAIAHMQIDSGLEVQLVAQEPMVVAPVAMSFDPQGRMWVVEMMGYMPDTSGNGENVPDGKVVILQDTNGDGMADKRTVFLDSLVLPRAICLIDSGILVATPPALWYYEIKNDSAGKRTLVDDKYADGGNVEHQPNGLFRAMDNWIYSAKSDRRYRRINGKWVKENTHFRGQWGISQDDAGRLFYNNNSQNLLGDYFLPGMGANNPHQREAAGFDEKIVPDNRVFPIRPTRGVNRGYVKGVLDDSGRLVSFTAACGPHIYRALALPYSYYGNAFVAEPAANLIKRDILTDSGLAVTGREAYEGKEFLASTDERFRPVNITTGPDGALYIADMYRGIIQHKTYLTGYLKQQIATRQLTRPLNCGRIYRIVPKGKKVENQPLLLNRPTKLLDLLHDGNGMRRDMAQQLIIDHQLITLTPALRQMMQDSTQLLGQRHALWALEGLHALRWEDVSLILHSGNQPMQIQAIAAIPSVLSAANIKSALPLIDSLLADKSLVPYAAWLLPAVGKWDKTAAKRMVLQLMKSYMHDRYISAALINNACDQESAMLKELQGINPDTTLVLYKALKNVLESMQSAEEKKRMAALELAYPRGHEIFTTICQTCHGKSGKGIASMAPPLNESNWVNGSKKSLISIVLYGLTGPVTVQGKVYQAPEISGDMPGIGGSGEYSHEDIAQLLSYIRNAWKNNGDKITEAEVKAVRQQYNGRQKPFTAGELQ